MLPIPLTVFLFSKLCP